MSPRELRFPLEAHTCDGLAYRIRPVSAADAQREREFIAALSPQSRYQRFMHNLREPGDALIARLVNVDFHRTMALVAVTGEGADERIIATAQYAADSDTECEFAVVVADDWQCRGVGTTLVPLLFDYAAREGFQTIYGTVLADNRRMIELAEWLGLTVDTPRHGDCTLRAWRKLQPPAGPRAAAWLTGAAALVDPGAFLLLTAANATPVVVARLLGRRLAAPIDALFRSRQARPVFGAHKTWRGLASGMGACAAAGALLPCGAWIGLSFGLLALTGDLASSFVKRRLRWREGHEVPFLDQLPESLLPLCVLAGPLELSAASIAGTAALFMLLDLLTARWRVHRA
jgi:RimJ/RimL family protein N-acetyltransferase